MEELVVYISKLEVMYKSFTDFTKTNPVVGGMFGVWLLGVVTYIFKSIPVKISRFLSRYMTVTATFSSGHESFHDLLRWFSETGRSKKTRSVRLSNGRYGWEESQISVGLGYHYFWYNFRPFRLNRKIENSNGGDKVKEEISITTIGFTQKILNKIIKESIPKKEKVQKVKTWSSEGWKYLQELDTRPIESVVLKKGQKERILEYIQEFKDSKEWCVKNGIPYRTGIILSGPPGTGKTSLVRAIGSYLEKDLCVISCDSVSDTAFQKAISSVPENSIILLEDIDSVIATHSRDNNDTYTETSGEPLIEIGHSVTLSGILNAIDGIFSSRGRIIIATTNCFDRLDSALIRPGRFDLKEELGYLDRDMGVRMFKRFYPEYNTDTLVLPENVSAAQVENCFLINKNNPDKAREAIMALEPYKNKNNISLKVFNK